MAERAMEIASLLLREGSLRRDDAEHRKVYAELAEDLALFNDVRDRGKLRQFMLRLGREAPDPFGPRSLAEALGLQSPPEPPPAPDPAAAR